MARPTLQESIKTGLLSPANLATLIGSTPPTIRAMCKAKKLSHIHRPACRNEIVLNAAVALYDLSRLGYYSHLRPPSSDFIFAAKNALVHLKATSPAEYTKLLPYVAPLLAKKPQ